MKLFLTKVRNLFDLKYGEDLEEDCNGSDDKEVVSVLLRLVPISHARTAGDKICRVLWSPDILQIIIRQMPGASAPWLRKRCFQIYNHFCRVMEMRIENIPKESV